MKTEVWIDPIVEEIHEIRRKMLEEAGNDPDVLFDRLLTSQEKSARRFAQISPCPVKLKRGA